MTDVLIYSDNMHGPELRHEVPVPAPDPFLYVEKNGTKHVVITSFEIDRMKEAGVEAHPLEAFGWDELIGKGPREEQLLKLIVQAVEGLDVKDAIVPHTFPLELADARDLFRRAEPSNGQLTVDGEMLTCELVKARITDVFNAHGLVTDEMIVAHGPQTALGHDFGSGPIAAGEPIVLDLFPRDRESGCYADMTRTFCIGEPPEKLVEYHRLVKAALERALEDVKAGAAGRPGFRAACDAFPAGGLPTQLSKQEGEVLDRGFYHGLGHGVGLEVHEAPWLSRDPGTVEVGDVITLEPW